MAETELSDRKMIGIPSKVFGYAIFLAYPLVFYNYYYDIVTCKYVVFVAMSLMLLIFTLILDGNVLLKNRHLVIADYVVLCLFLINLLSTVGSEYKIYALNGADGRFNGLVTVFLYVIIYFIFSRGDFNRNRFYAILAMGSVMVSVFGILNFVDIDVLGFYDGLGMEQKQFYISTLGHVNVYSSYFALTIPVLLINYLNAETIRKMGFYFFVSLINILALLCGGCESAAIILAVAVVGAVWFCNGIHMVKWTGLLCLVLVLNKILIYINERSEERRILSNTVKILGDKRIAAGIVITCVCMIFVELLLKRKSQVRWLKYGVILLGLLISAIYLMAFLYFSVADRKTDLYGMERFLRFSDEFGSYRGYIWKVVIREFRSLSPYQKLFGIGTDTLRPYLVDRYGEKMYHVTGAYYDNAHNEFLQYLITTGIAGLVAYVSFVVIQIKKGVGKADKVILCGVICYVVQSVVNINQVVTTPLFVVMISMLSGKENACIKSN